MKQIAMFYIPMPDKISAEKTACDLLEKRLISCANIIDANSYFSDKSSTKKNDEKLLLAKTFIENINPVLEYVEKTHPYKTPFIAHYNLNVNDKYFDWMTNQIK